MADVGYIRVSSLEQNLARQLEQIRLDKIFEEKASAAAKRPVLAECIAYLREGDILHVHSIDRLARSLIELQSLVKDLNSKGVTVHFHSENMIFGEGKAFPMQELLFQILGAFAQFERSIIKERQAEGIAKAKKEGRHLGRPRKISLQDKQAILVQLAEGRAPSAIAEEYGVSVSSVYKVRGNKN